MGPTHPFPFNRIGRIAQPGSIRKGDNIATQVQANLNNVSGRSRDFRYNRRVPPRQFVQKGRLPNIGRPHDSNPNAIAYGRGQRAKPDILLPFLNERGDGIAVLIQHIGRQIILRKIYRCFNQGKDADQSIRPILVSVMPRTGGQAQRQPALCFRFGRNQIRQGLRFGQIHIAIGEGAAGKFPGFGQATAGIVTKRCQYCCDGRRPPVAMQFNNILPGERCGARKIKDQGVVQNVWVRRSIKCGLIQFASVSASWLWYPLRSSWLPQKKGLKGRQCIWARQTYNRNTRRCGSAAERKYRITH